MDIHGSRRWLFATVILLLVSLGSCIQPDNPQDVKEKTAKATEEAKRDAKAIAEGIREGWSRDKPLNLNTATKEQLQSLQSKYDRIADLVKAK